MYIMLIAYRLFCVAKLCNLIFIHEYFSKKEQNISTLSYDLFIIYALLEVNEYVA